MGQIYRSVLKRGKQRAKSEMCEKKRSELEVSQHPRAISSSVIISPPQT